MSKICKILSNLRWFEIGTSGLNQNFGSIQARAIILIFISNFQNSIIFKSGRIKAAYKFVVFRKIVTLLRKWRHCSASFQKNSKVKPYKERRSPYLNHVFYFKSISCLVFAWEHNKKDTFLQFFQTPPNVYIIYCICLSLTCFLLYKGLAVSLDIDRERTFKTFEDIYLLKEPTVFFKFRILM